MNDPRQGLKNEKQATSSALRRHASIILPCVIGAGGIVVLQASAMGFWRDALASPVGYGWSGLLELIALWLWFRRKSPSSQHWLFWRAIAFLTSALLLAGPLYEATKPLFASDAKSAYLDAEIERLSNLSALYQANSRERPGWQGKVDETEGKLAKLTAQRWGFDPSEKAEKPSETSYKTPGQRRFILGMHVAAILIAWGVVILAITTVSEHFEPTRFGAKQASPETAKRPRATPLKPSRPSLLSSFRFRPWWKRKTGPSEADLDRALPDSPPKEGPLEPLESDAHDTAPPASASTLLSLPSERIPVPTATPVPQGPDAEAVRALVPMLQALVKERIDSGQSYATISNETRISTKGISYLVNHFKRAAKGEEVHGLQALRAIEAKLKQSGGLSDVG